MYWLRNYCVGSAIGLFAALYSVAAAADEWLPPTKETYHSRNGQMRLVVIPRTIVSPLAYFDDKVKGKEPAGEPEGDQNTSAHAILEKRTDKGRWTSVWNTALVNEVSPVDAIVADSGRYVVTFDNWHSMGWGENVVVIYGPDGSIVRSLSLADFLPAEYIKALPHTVSSIHWGGKHHFSSSDNKLILEVVVPSTDSEEKPVYTNLDIDLSNGQVLPEENPSWNIALVQAQRVAAAKQKGEEAATAARIAPLVGPTTTGDLEWHLYLIEAFFRLDPAWDVNYPATNVLRSPKASDYKPSEEWICEALLQKRMPVSVLMIASPSDPENLINVLSKCARGIRTGALSKARIYVAVPNVYRERVAAALESTGASVIHLDPTVPIPQRTERLPHSLSKEQ